MGVGEAPAAAAAAAGGGLGAHIDLCHFSVSLAPLHLFLLSLFTSLHITHTNTHTQGWTNYTRAVAPRGGYTSVCSSLEQPAPLNSPKQLSPSTTELII